MGTLAHWRGRRASRLLAFFLGFVIAASCVLVPGRAMAVTIQTVNVGGKYLPMTGTLNNPVVGTAVQLGTLLTKANPWMVGISSALIVAQLAQSLGPALEVAIRPPNVANPVPDWAANGNLPPATLPAPNTRLFWVGNNSAYQADTTGLQGQTTAYLQAQFPARGPITGYSGYSLGTCVNTATVGSTCTQQGTATFQNGSTSFLSSVTVAVKSGNCPSGYTLSGGNCALSNASAVMYPSDGVGQVTNVGGTFQADPRDPDAAPSNVVGQGLIETVSSDGKDKIRIEAQPDGSVKLGTEKTALDADGVIRTYKQYMTINNAGAVTSYSTSTSESSVVNNTVVNNTTGGTSDAKDATLQEIKTQAATDRTSAETVAGTVTGALNATKGGGQDTVGGLALPNGNSSPYTPQDTSSVAGALPSGAGCVTLNVTLPVLGPMVIDPCPVVTVVRPLVNHLVVALAAIGALFAVMGRREDGAG